MKSTLSFPCLALACVLAGGCGDSATSSAPDLGTADLQTPRDLASPDLVTPPDLTPVPDLGRYLPAFESFISPGGSGHGQLLTWARDVTYTIASQGPATLYYTVDGSEPMQGAAGTMSGASPVKVVGMGDMTIRWRADYGYPTLLEPGRTIVHKTDDTTQKDYGVIVENTKLGVDNAQVIIVAPGATVMGTADIETWRSAQNGYCPGCIIQLELVFEKAIVMGGCFDNVAADGTYPGMSRNIAFSFTAPMAPGRYPLGAGMTLDFMCKIPNGVLEIGEVIVK